MVQAQTLMQLQLIDAPKRPRIALGSAFVRQLVEHAERLTGLEEGTLYSSRRAREVSWVRFVVMKVAWESGRSLGLIGRVFGMDHTSIIHGIRRADELAEQMPEFAELLKLLRRGE